MSSKFALFATFGLAVGALALSALLGAWLFYNWPSAELPGQESQEYNPAINPSDFSSPASNAYFPIAVGVKRIYEGKTEEGTERTEVYVTNNSRKVMGVNAVVVQDMVFLNGELIEDTEDWFAQDKFGNVWYFGEDSKELVNGKIASTEGSWEAGVDGAKPGIIMKASPKAGDKYRQEFYPGIAEDMAEVVALGAEVKVSYGSFSDCVQTREWTPLEPGVAEYKYYCPGIGLVLEQNLEDDEYSQLIDVQAVSSAPKAEKPAEALKKEVTEAEAIQIALKEVPGKVTDVAIEKKFGVAAYVVEIAANQGGEIDVIIDISTGEVLEIER